MSEEEIKALEKQVEIEKKRVEAEKKRLAEEERIAELRKTLKSLKKETSPSNRFFKKIANVSGTVLDNIEINRGKESSGCELGDKVIITNGRFAGKEMIINMFIVGGIEGNINNQSVRIRHGSYYLKPIEEDKEDEG